MVDPLAFRTICACPLIEPSIPKANGVNAPPRVTPRGLGRCRGGRHQRGPAETDCACGREPAARSGSCCAVPWLPPD